LIAFLAIAAIGDALGWLVGSRLYTVARTSRLAGVDAAIGSVVSIVALLLAIWFVGLKLAAGPFPSLARQIRGWAATSIPCSKAPRTITRSMVTWSASLTTMPLSPPFTDTVLQANTVGRHCDGPRTIAHRRPAGEPAVHGERS
jgi:hypothetical protein